MNHLQPPGREAFARSRAFIRRNGIAMSQRKHDQYLDLLILADIHYVDEAQHTCRIPKRRTELGLELVRRVWNRAVRSGRPDAVVLMGDLVDNGDADGADKDLARLCDELADKGVPVLVVPGNHDGDYERLFRIFGKTGDSYRFLPVGTRTRAERSAHGQKSATVPSFLVLTFADRYGLDDQANRSREELSLVAQTRRQHPDSPIIVFQHSPVHPPIESDYPYNLGNRDEVMAAYAEAGVTLSVSGHYHGGLPLSQVNGVGYVTAPALCEAPFRFLRVRVRGRERQAGHGDPALQLGLRPNLGGAEYSVEEISLAMDAGLGLVDHHAHTQFAYCADDITAEAAIARAQDFGLAGITFAEHAAHLYLSRDDYSRAAFLDDPGIMRREREAGRGRMAQYRRMARRLRSDFVRFGLEVECDGDGGLTLLDEDRDGWDILVGALHYLPELRNGGASSAEVNRGFMAANERICGHGVAVLAHPFRIFRRNKQTTPTELYRPMADLLAATGVAAEVNFHTNQPDPRFFALCLERGVRIALASDAHALHEVGEFAPHLELLRKLELGTVTDFFRLLDVDASAVDPR
jgi:histidinol phosphatase-like PHP family hydrolase/predicted MPP superfamily phosphohydrolase